MQSQCASDVLCRFVNFCVVWSEVWSLLVRATSHCKATRAEGSAVLNEWVTSGLTLKLPKKNRFFQLDDSAVNSFRGSSGDAGGFFLRLLLQFNRLRFYKLWQPPDHKNIWPRFLRQAEFPEVFFCLFVYERDEQTFNTFVFFPQKLSVCTALPPQANRFDTVLFARIASAGQKAWKGPLVISLPVLFMYSSTLQSFPNSTRPCAREM